MATQREKIWKHLKETGKDGPVSHCCKSAQVRKTEQKEEKGHSRDQREDLISLRYDETEGHALMKHKSNTHGAKSMSAYRAARNILPILAGRKPPQVLALPDDQ